MRKNETSEEINDDRRRVLLHATAKALGAFGVWGAIAVCTLYVTNSTAQSTKEDQPKAGSEASPIYGVTIPAGYRDWHLISVGHLAGGNLKQLRAQLGNDIAIKAFREGKLPFPDGAIIAALHWNEVSSDSNNKVLASGFPGAGLQSSFAGSAENVQFMVKDSKKYAATGGWGFADFKNGKPGDEALHKTCFPCHAPAEDHDFVFARYAPAP
jgi:Cytochrome P460